MDLIEAREKRRELEKAILNLINTFESETDLNVDNIELDQVRYVIGKSKTVNITIPVKL